MRALVFLNSMMLLLSFASPASAGKNWEACLDKADFAYDVYGTLQSATTTTVKKEGCRMTFAAFGGKGEKYEIDLCDPSIRIDAYGSLTETAPHRIYAGSAGCPAPLFGADFDSNSKEITEYKEARGRIFDLFDVVKASYGEGWLKVDVSNPGTFSDDRSDNRIACAQFLIREYLTSCMSFEQKKTTETSTSVKTNTKSDIPGVHDQTITVPKK